MRPGAPTSKSQFSWRLSGFDLAWAVVAPFIALGLRDPALLDLGFHGGVFPHSYQFAGLTIAFAIPAFLFFRLSDGMSRYFSSHDFWSVIAASLTVVAASDVTLFVINRLDGVPRSTPLIYGLVLGVGLLGGRSVAHLSHLERPPEAERRFQPQMRRVIVVGVDRFAATAIKLTDCQQPRTTQIVAALDARERLTGRTINGVKIVGRPGDLEALIEEYAVHGMEVDEVWFASTASDQGEIDRIEHQCRALGVKAWAIAQALNLAPQQALLSHETRAQPKLPALRASYFRFKRAFDVALAAILLVALAPLAAIVAGLTYYDVGAPVIFWQRRLGRSGHEFFMFKFRTYQAPFTKSGEPVAGDARLSKLGEAIRATRLDEIPQLFNILRGDMSLIGPRPLLPVDQPQDARPRLLVRPGVTGWAQVNGGTLVTTEEKDALDVWYIHHASPFLDLGIVFKTLKIVFHGENRRHGEIEAAVAWRAAARRIDQHLFGDDATSNRRTRLRDGQYDNRTEIEMEPSSATP